MRLQERHASSGRTPLRRGDGTVQPVSSPAHDECPWGDVPHQDHKATFGRCRDAAAVIKTAARVGAADGSRRSCDGVQIVEAAKRGHRFLVRDPMVVPVGRMKALLHESELARTDPDPQ